VIRWNISKIFFLGVAGQLREITLQPNSVNIITGASGTGKSALIKAIDYCLGSSKCELPAHVRRRSVAVGVKWVCGETEVVVTRIIPPVGKDTSTKMSVVSGRNVSLPSKLSDLEGSTTIEVARAYMERIFGIGDIELADETSVKSKGKASIRQVTPYLFVTKEVIDSETALFHGLDRPEKAFDAIAAMPYFLKATDAENILNEVRLRQLRKRLETEEAKERKRVAAESLLKQKSFALLMDASRIGLVAEPVLGYHSESEYLDLLRGLQDGKSADIKYPDGSLIEPLYSSRKSILQNLAEMRVELRSVKETINDANTYSSTVSVQHKKLMLAQHLGLDDVSAICPVCESPSDAGKSIVKSIKSAVQMVQADSVVIERVKPRLLEREQQIIEKITSFNKELKSVDGQIKNLIQQTEEARKLESLGHLRAHLLGRISYFLESIKGEPVLKISDFAVLKSEIRQLEQSVNKEAKEEKLRRAESKISQFASEIFSKLPTVAPCIHAELNFSSRKPEVTISEAGSNSILRMSDIGSDQNYLAVHIALMFGLHQYFELVKSPVPGLLVFDQISRPYFPSRGENEELDEHEIKGGLEDEDVRAMRQHIETLFKETAKREGLQVLLIEHAYFADDQRYVKATKERWTRASGKALIPLDWPLREDS